MIGLLFSAVRFNFLEMQTLFDIARDHETVRKNSYFIKKLDLEITRRMISNNEI